MKYWIYPEVVSYFLEQSFRQMKEEETKGSEMTVGTITDDNGRQYEVKFTLDPVEDSCYEVSCSDSFTPMVTDEDQ